MCNPLTCPHGHAQARWAERQANQAKEYRDRSNVSFALGVSGNCPSDYAVAGGRRQAS